MKNVIRTIFQITVCYSVERVCVCMAAKTAETVRCAGKTFFFPFIFFFSSFLNLVTEMKQMNGGGVGEGVAREQAQSDAQICFVFGNNYAKM